VADSGADERGVRVEGSCSVAGGELGVREFVLLQKRQAVERSFVRVTRFRCLVRDDAQLPEAFAGLNFAVFGILF
jgi:hypothetical protein